MALIYSPSFTLSRANLGLPELAIHSNLRSPPLFFIFVNRKGSYPKLSKDLKRAKYTMNFEMLLTINSGRDLGFKLIKREVSLLPVLVKRPVQGHAELRLLVGINNQFVVL